MRRTALMMYDKCNIEQIFETKALVFNKKRLYKLIYCLQSL